MNVTCPAVVRIPSSSSSPCNSSARQPSFANGESPFHRTPPSQTGRCALSSSAPSLNSSFVQLTHRHRRHISSKKVLLVTLRSSAFDFDGDRGSLQKRFAREREDPSSKFGVSWVSDGMDSWAPQKQQDKAFRTESRDFRSSPNQRASSVSSSSNSFSPNNQQTFSLSQKLPTNFSLTRKQQTRVIDPSAASRLQNRLPAFKQAAEPDAFGASFSPVHGADAFSSCNGQSPSTSGTVMQKSSSLEEGSSRRESVFTSKLEEILNKFRTREKQSSSRDELYEVGRTALQSDTIPNEGFQAKRSYVNRLQANGDRRTARRDGQNPRSIGSGSETSVKENDFNEEEISFSTARHQRDSHRERRLGMPNGNAGGLYKTVNASSNVVDNSTPLPWEGQGVHSPASKIQSSIKKGSSNFTGAHVTKSSPSSVFGNNGRSPNLDSHDGNWSTGIKKPGETGKGSKPSFISQNDNNPDSRKPVVSEFDWTDSDEEDKSDTVSSITSDDGASTSHSKKADQPSSGSSMGVKTGNPKSTMNGDQPSSGSSMGVKTGNPKSTMNGKIATWHSHFYPNLPFEFQYSYSETPKAPIIRYREEPFSPFGPDTMGRPWTGRPPLKKSKKNLPEFDSFKPPPTKKGIKFVQPPGPFPEGQGPTPSRSREEILGEPLTGEEIVDLVDKCRSERRQLNLGRDGLTHNMLDLIHCHWKRRVVVKIKCLGVPTVDMDNVCFHLEDKTGGKIIYRTGGSVYLFRGRNYNYKDRPDIPIMLWRPITPVYPKLIKRAPEGLTQDEAEKLRLLGRKVEPLCTLGKNGVYLSLVKDVRAAFRVDDLVLINCRGLNRSDYKKIGAKLRDLVPCVLLSFDDEQILMWKGKAMVSANVDADTSSGMEAAIGSEVEAAKPSASCGVDDDESQSAIEEIKQQALVVDTTGVSTGRSDCSISAGAEGWSDLSTATGSIDQISIPQLFNDDLRFEDFRETGFLARSEVKSTLPTVFDVEDDIKSDKANPMFEYTMPNDRTFDIMPGQKRESNTASSSQFNESRRFMELNSFANDQGDEQVVPNTVLKLDEKSTKLESSRDTGAGKEGLNDTRVVRLDALWDDAIASGIAIQLDEIDADSDVVVRKASELEKAVPPVAEYTRKLQSKLRIKRKPIPRPDGDLRIHFANLQKAKSQKKAAKRAFRLPAVDVPDNGGLPIEELARILSIK